MPRPERLIVGIAGPLFVLAAALEALSRLIDRPALHEAATWCVMAALFVVLTPIAAAAAIIAGQSLVGRKNKRDSDDA